MRVLNSPSTVVLSALLSVTRMSGRKHFDSNVYGAISGSVVYRTGQVCSNRNTSAFSAKDGCTVDGVGFAVVDTSRKYPFNQFTELELYGRFGYIDNITSSTVIFPPLNAFPCLNMLVMPPSCVQTPHCHPSLRVGMVVDGKGVCVTKTRMHRLRCGDVFAIHADEVHNFVVGKKSAMTLVTYHPHARGPTSDENIILENAFFK